jgi:hypothetical protein
MKEQITNRIVDAEASTQRTAPFPAKAQGKVTRNGGSTIVPIGQTYKSRPISGKIQNPAKTLRCATASNAIIVAP